jgi:hypothetical protein
MPSESWRRESWGPRAVAKVLLPSAGRGAREEANEPHKAHAPIGRGKNFGSAGRLERFVRAIAAPVMGSVITFSLLTGLVAGIAIGYFSHKVRSMAMGIAAGIAIAAIFSLAVVLRAGMALFSDIVLLGMLLGAIVGFATQRFGRAAGSSAPVRSSHWRRVSQS